MTLALIFTFSHTQADDTSLATLDQTLNSKSCGFWRDPQDVVHIKGDDELTAMACWGYAHARDRLFQMDFFRRTVQGRKADIQGSGAIKTDFGLRVLGLYNQAKRIWKKMPEEGRLRFTAYAHGVNVGMKEALEAGVYEFKKLGYKPDPWKPEDSIAILLLQSFDQCRKTIVQDIDEEALKKKFGEDARLLFTSDGVPWDTSILKPGEFLEKRETAVASAPLLSPNRERVLRSDDLGNTGSNNWVISQSRSRSRKAWLANDPHLELVHPPFWQWIHVEGGDLDAIGASLPGVPVIASGANRFMAWGLTTSYYDTAEVSYVPESDLKESETFRPLIWVKFWKIKLPFFFKSYRMTKEGYPILPNDAPKGMAAVLRWTGFSVDENDIMALYQMMKSTTVHEEDDVFKNSKIPSWNFVFADNKGNIGYRVNGRLPKIKSPKTFGIEQHRLQDLADWPLLTPNENPGLINPERGYIVTANNRHFPKEAELTGGRAYSASFRAFRIEEMLQATELHDLESLKKIQCDIEAPDARFFNPYLISALQELAPTKLSSKLKEHLLTELRTWDYMTTRGCTACPIYRRWMDLVKEATGFNEAAFYRFLKSPRAQELKFVLQDAILDLIKDLKIRDDKPLPAWGELHQAPIPNVSQAPELVDSQSLPTPGDQFSVNVGTPRWENGHWVHTWGASQRMLVELTRTPTIYAVLAGPNQDIEHRTFYTSDHPWKKWLECELEKRIFPLDWNKTAASQVSLKVER